MKSHCFFFFFLENPEILRNLNYRTREDVPSWSDDKKRAKNISTEFFFFFFVTICYEELSAQQYISHMIT